MTDFTIKRGDDRVLDIAVKDASGAAVNLTGAELWFSMRRRYDDVSPFLTKEIGTGITVDNALLGLCHVDLAAADTDALLPVTNVFLWDLQTRIATKITTLAWGQLRVDPDVTVGAP